MTYHICSIEQNIEGTWDARVCLSEEETFFFNFGYYPTDEEVQERAAQLIYQRELNAYLEEQNLNTTME
jgi:hypothetical protein